MAINAHLYYGNYIDDRRQEFNALVDWIMHRFKTESHAYFPNFILMGDLNLDYDNPATDRARVEQRIKSLNGELDGANVNFPFLDVHPGRPEVFRTNARMSETFDQIGLFNRDSRLPTHVDNATMGTQTRGRTTGCLNSVTSSARRYWVVHTGSSRPLKDRSSRPGSSIR